MCEKILTLPETSSVTGLPWLNQPTHYCTISTEAGFFREFSKFFGEKPYRALISKTRSFLKDVKPEVSKCLSQIPDALACQKETELATSLHLACHKLGFVPSFHGNPSTFDAKTFIQTCQDQLEQSRDPDGSNEVAIAFGKVVESTSCSLEEISKLIDTSLTSQPECKDAQECLGSNISKIPAPTRLYRFPGNRSLRWNHSIQLVNEYNPKIDTFPGSTRVSTNYASPVRDCTSADLESIYLTDRLTQRIDITSVNDYTPKSLPNTSKGWDDWFFSKQDIFKNEATKFEIEDADSDIFLDVTPKDSNGNKIASSIDILKNLGSRKLSSKSCKIRVVSVTSLPTEGSIVAINTEAARLLDNIESTGKAYLNAKKYDDFIKQFELPRLETSVLALESSFKTLIKAAMSGSCEELPPPPFLPISGFVPYGPDAELTSCEDAGKNPADYGLQATDWSNIDLKALNLFVFNEEEKGYRLNLSLEKTPWYFEARERQPRIRDAIEKTLVEIAQIMTGIYFKKNPSALPEDYKLPELAKAHKDLGDAMEFARTFLSAFDAYKDTLSEKLEEIRTKIKAYDDSKGITTTTTPS